MIEFNQSSDLYCITAILTRSAASNGENRSFIALNRRRQNCASWLHTACRLLIVFLHRQVFLCDMARAPRLSKQEAIRRRLERESDSSEHVDEDLGHRIKWKKKRKTNESRRNSCCIKFNGDRRTDIRRRYKQKRWIWQVKMVMCGSVNLLSSLEDDMLLNILHERGGPKLTANKNSLLDKWSLFFSDEILNTIITKAKQSNITWTVMSRNDLVTFLSILSFEKIRDE